MNLLNVYRFKNIQHVCCIQHIQGCKSNAGGGLKLAMFAQFWKIIAHSRALAEIYVLALLSR